MASLANTKTLFGFTSPRTLEKIIPEVRILTQNFSGETWSGNTALQEEFFSTLYNTDCYEGTSYPSDPAFAARDRITRAPKALGFVDLQPTIQLTEAGKTLLAEKRIEEVFTRQLLKFQLPSPYHVTSQSIEFGVKPYLELLRLIFDLESISKTEIAIFFLQLTHIDKYDSTVEKIREFRAGTKKYKGSRKTYVSECMDRELQSIFHEELVQEKDPQKAKDLLSRKRSNARDYADAFFRYIRATGLVTTQERTLRLIISEAKKEDVKYILEHVEQAANTFSSQQEFKQYLFAPDIPVLLSDDPVLLAKKIQRLQPEAQTEGLSVDALKDTLEEIQHLLQEKNIAKKKKGLQQYRDNQDISDITEVFELILQKDVPDPSLFLEWNVWRAFVMLNFATRVDGNFTMDIDGMPLKYAPGKMPDIEVEYDNFALMVEVTLSSGQKQYEMEGEPVPRHFGNLKNELGGKELYCMFIATTISEGTLAHFYNLNKMHTKYYGGKTKIIPVTVEDFVTFTDHGIQQKFNDPNVLQKWLERMWKAGHRVEDERLWLDEVTQSIQKWMHV